jgi:hypothetical protein
LNTDQNISPTPYNDINFFLHILLDDVRAILDNRFIGMYLYGSLASGEFDTSRSDVDFLVVTTEVLPQNTISDLKTMHLSLYDSGSEWATRLEGAYIPLNDVRVYSPAETDCVLVHFNKLYRRKEFLVTHLDSNWIINRHILYTSGIVIAGPPLHTIIDPVQPKELQEAALVALRNNWTPRAANSSFFLGMEYQPFMVLQMCRSLYILNHGAVTSKLSSARWVIEYSDKKWTGLIEQAMAWHYGDPLGDIGQTREFIRYILKEAGL